MFQYGKNMYRTTSSTDLRTTPQSFPICKAPHLEKELFILIFLKIMDPLNFKTIIAWKGTCRDFSAICLTHCASYYSFFILPQLSRFEVVKTKQSQLEETVWSPNIRGGTEDLAIQNPCKSHVKSRLTYSNFKKKPFHFTRNLENIIADNELASLHKQPICNSLINYFQMQECIVAVTSSGVFLLNITNPCFIRPTRAHKQTIRSAGMLNEILFVIMIEQVESKIYLMQIDLGQGEREFSPCQSDRALCLKDTYFISTASQLFIYGQKVLTSVLFNKEENKVYAGKSVILEEGIGSWPPYVTNGEWLAYSGRKTQLLKVIHLKTFQTIDTNLKYPTEKTESLIMKDDFLFTCHKDGILNVIYLTKNQDYSTCISTISSVLNKKEVWPLDFVVEYRKSKGPVLHFLVGSRETNRQHLHEVSSLKIYLKRSS